MAKVKTKGWQRGRRGAVLAFSVILVVILAILGYVMIQLGSMARVQSARTVADIKARAAADAGLVEAVVLMNKKLRDEDVWDNSDLPSATDALLPGANARYSYDIKGDQTVGFVVVSTGESAYAGRTVYTGLSIESMWFGIGVRQDLTIMSKTTFSTYPPGGKFSVRTNSTVRDSVKLYPGTYVPGDVVIGPGGHIDDVIVDKKSTVIDGDVYAAAEEIDFPEPVVPPLPYKGALPPPKPGDPNTIELRADDSGIYDSIILGQGKKLDITHGDVVIYVTGEVRLHQGAELIIVSNASEPSFTMYLGGNMLADQGSFIITENQKDTGIKFKLFGTDTCKSIILKNSGDLAAGIYAPSADLEIKNSGDTIGAFTGNSLTMKNSGKLIFDTRLLDVGIDDPMAYLAGRWWED